MKGTRLRSGKASAEDLQQYRYFRDMYGSFSFRQIKDIVRSSLLQTHFLPDKHPSRGICGGYATVLTHAAEFPIGSMVANMLSIWTNSHMAKSLGTPLISMQDRLLPVSVLTNDLSGLLPVAFLIVS